MYGPTTSPLSCLSVCISLLLSIWAMGACRVRTNSQQRSPHSKQLHSTLCISHDGRARIARNLPVPRAPLMLHSPITRIAFPAHTHIAKAARAHPQCKSRHCMASRSHPRGVYDSWQSVTASRQLLMSGMIPLHTRMNAECTTGWHGGGKRSSVPPPLCQVRHVPPSRRALSAVDPADPSPPPTTPWSPRHTWHVASCSRPRNLVVVAAWAT